MFERVDFCSAREAGEMQPPESAGLISINNPGDDAQGVQAGWAAVLRLWFHDIDDASSVAAKLAGYEAMNAEQATLVIEWTDEWRSSLDTVIIHCAAGISRSAAVALWIAERHHCAGPGLVFKARLYNRHVYSLLNYVAYGPMVSGKQGQDDQ